MEVNLRKAEPDDAASISILFSSTIRAINSKDYDPHQIKVWSEVPDSGRWVKKISEQYFVLAEENVLLGFASLADDGLVDFFFVHKDYQGRKIGTTLMNEIEKIAKQKNINRLYAEVSITARPFFESRGFKLIKVFIKVFKETEFIDNLMEKNLT
ncbi:GNAT family N-acetyltransferase [soil metagenome]